MAEYSLADSEDLEIINELFLAMDDQEDSDDEGLPASFSDRHNSSEDENTVKTETQVEKSRKQEAELSQTPPEIKQEVIVDSVMTTRESIRQEAQTNMLKSARRDDNLSDEGHERYSPNASFIHRHSYRRQRLDSGRNTTSPVSAPVTSVVRYSPTSKTSPPLHGLLSTPNDIHSLTSSSSSEGIYSTLQQQKETVNDSGSLERNVSSLNIAQENIRNLQSTLPTLNREYQHRKKSLTPPSLPPPPAQKKVDEFIPPAAIVRNGNHHRNGSFPGYPQKIDSLSHSDPPQEQTRIIINENEYTVLQRVGEGSSGKVFQVFSHEQRDLFALKWIRIKPGEDRSSILNEIQLMKSLRDDTIITLLDYKDTPNAIYIIMEYGEIDFAHLLRLQFKRLWDVNFIRYYFNQMLHAVYTIHKSNIVHSDLKPANFVVVKGSLKLIDFGIAKKVSDDTTNIQRDTQIGTINYMAPEALMDRNDGSGGPSLTKLGRPSDVWSLGCILYQMIYGVTPFYHLPMPKKVYSITNPNYQISFAPETNYGDPPQKIEVPQLLIKLLENCLNRDPVLRSPLSELIRHPFVNIPVNM